MMDLDQIRQDVADVIDVNPQEIPEDANLILLGLDSLGIMRLVTAWGRRGIRVSFDDVVADPTPINWKAVLDKAERATHERAPVTPSED